MKAMILAAGLGTRLKPWTDEHPKALVPVGGVPMLERVILKLRSEGFERIIINVHHFADQIEDFLKVKDFGGEIILSDERGKLLETGGGILNASRYLCSDTEPVLIHNVDILTKAPLAKLMRTHVATGNEATLLVSNRDSGRRLIFDKEGELYGWKNMLTGELRPSQLLIKGGEIEQDIQRGDLRMHAFSGIHVMNPSIIEEMRKWKQTDCFSVMEFYLAMISGNLRIRGYMYDDPELIDIGKPESLAKANLLIKSTPEN